MKSSNTSSWEPNTKQNLSNIPRIGEETLITISTRELVEFYWSNRKRFSGNYYGFQTELKTRNLGK